MLQPAKHPATRSASSFTATSARARQRKTRKGGAEGAYPERAQLTPQWSSHERCSLAGTVIPAWLRGSMAVEQPRPACQHESQMDIVGVGQTTPLGLVHLESGDGGHTDGAGGAATSLGGGATRAHVEGTTALHGHDPVAQLRWRQRAAWTGSTPEGGGRGAADLCRSQGTQAGYHC